MKKIISVILCLALILGLSVMVAAAENELEIVTAPETGVAYKLGLYQATNGDQLYFNGTTPEGKSYWLDTTTDVAEAADVYLESVGGSYRIYFMEGSAKKYIEMYGYFKSGSSYPSGTLKLTDAPENTYVWDSTLNTLILEYDDSNSFYMGTYSNYTTISVSSTYYVTGDNAASVGVSQFVAQLYAEKVEETTAPTTESTNATTAPTTESTGATTAPTTESTKATTAAPTETDAETTAATTVTSVITKVSTPSTGVAYKLGCNQENLGSSLYFIGETANTEYYMATSDAYADGVDVYLESVDGGYRMYFMNGSTKTYIDIILTDTGYVNLSLTTSPSAVYTWNTEYQTLVTSIEKDGETIEYYMGTYSEYSTLSASKLSYAESSFPCHLYTKTTSTNVETGDSISVIVALLAVSAIGIAVLGKKKEF